MKKQIILIILLLSFIPKSRALSADTNFNCSAWQDCSAEGTQKRTCQSLDGSTAGMTFVETQECTPCIENIWDCGDWGVCSSSDYQIRTCTKTIGCLSSTTAPITTQSCIYSDPSQSNSTSASKIDNSFKIKLPEGRDNGVRTGDKVYIDSLASSSWITEAYLNGIKLDLKNIYLDTFLVINSLRFTQTDYFMVPENAKDGNIIAYDQNKQEVNIGWLDIYEPPVDCSIYGNDSYYWEQRNECSCKIGTEWNNDKTQCVKIDYVEKVSNGTNDIDNDNVPDNIDYYPNKKSDYIIQEYNFKYELEDGHYGEDISIKINIPKDLYIFYKNQNHIFSKNYNNITSFVTPNDIVIADIINQVNNYYRDKGLNFFWIMLKLVAEITYAKDEFSVKGWDEYPKYPVETLLERAGDCEDTTFLMASLIKAMDVEGTEPTLVRFSDHLGLAVLADKDNPNKKFLYLETTGETVDSYSFGIMPDILANRSYTLHHLEEYKRTSNYIKTETETQKVIEQEKSLVTKADEKLSKRVSGNILLQVESKGEGWYVNPDNKKKYYLGKPADAFSIMRNLGLGIKHSELSGYLNLKFPSRLSGKIMLDVEKKGEAYYVNPKDLKGYFLNKSSDAFQVMRNLGLGITNTDIRKIEVGEIE